MQITEIIGDKCYVYFIRAGAFIKIGVAENPERRRDQLQTANALKLEIIETWGYSNKELAIEDERILHQYFEGVRCEGEWFIGKYVEKYLYELREINNQKMAKRLMMPEPTQDELRKAIIKAFPI